MARRTFSEKASHTFAMLIGIALVLAATAVAWHLATGRRFLPVLLFVYLLVTLVLSLVSFIAYGVDKRRARSGERRISERKLHRLEILGGWPGAVIARQFFAHKTSKMSYRLHFWLIVLMHLIVIAVCVYFVVTQAD